ncbi:hypothetical protein [Falsiroseomonas sp.]|uniref:hypothetical protein n=1 Tax=Falsiroseomonas sp. TaxID=2870721 RepID=UPI002715BB8F|nr:hypothetical protein [Falsiroseomonas sp.]MDO9499708.1 hypothetical protein [Falsiroseomonas sp.]
MMQGDDPRDGDPGKPGRDAAAELEALAEDWIALWQSEIAGLAADREAAEGWAAMTATWSALGAAWLRAAASPPFGRPPPGGAPNPFGMAHWPSPGWPGPTHDSAAAPPRPAPAAAAPDAGGEPRDGGDPERGDAALAARLAELERRLAALEPGRAPVPGGAGGDAKDRRRPRRRKPAG